MPRPISVLLLCAVSAALFAEPSAAQAPPAAPQKSPASPAQTPSSSGTASASSAVEHAIDLAATGQCPFALPQLRKSLPQISNKDLKYRAAMATAKCAMSLDQSETALQALFLLKRDFPRDPEVLYISTHYFSQLATRTSQELAAVAPSSYQAHELEAEALESQNKWDEAAAEYNTILSLDPNVPGIHYRLGRVALAKLDTAAGAEEAKKQFEAELQIDPSNAASEFWLGEIARRAGQWNEAIAHFSKASQLDASFAEAYLGLGMTLNAAERFQDGVSPLERYVKMVPGDPAGHYQLAISYVRIGRKQDADREIAIQRQISEKIQANKSVPGPGAPRQ
jgi:tetratricopeptide (TPR) repeat protein